MAQLDIVPGASKVFGDFFVPRKRDTTQTNALDHSVTRLKGNHHELGLIRCVSATLGRSCLISSVLRSFGASVRWWELGIFPHSTARPASQVLPPSLMIVGAISDSPRQSGWIFAGPSGWLRSCNRGVVVLLGVLKRLRWALILLSLFPSSPHHARHALRHPPHLEAPERLGHVDDPVRLRSDDPGADDGGFRGLGRRRA